MVVMKIETSENKVLRSCLLVCDCRQLIEMLNPFFSHATQTTQSGDNATQVLLSTYKGW